VPFELRRQLEVRRQVRDLDRMARGSAAWTATIGSTMPGRETASRALPQYDTWYTDAGEQVDNDGFDIGGFGTFGF
jgi:hypothetical protein